MTVSITEKEYLQAKELEKLGIPLDNELLAKSRAALRGFYIDQDPNIPQTMLFDSIPGGTGVLITLSIQNGTEQTICLSSARLDIPWCNQLGWLEDPMRSAQAKPYYTVPISGSHRIERDFVLNHRIGRTTKIHPGDRLDGFLLGVAPESIPGNYIDRSIFKARLSIFDTRNNAYTQGLTFLVCRYLKNRANTSLENDNRPIGRLRRRLEEAATNASTGA